MAVFLCPFGRDKYDEAHRTCVCCIRDNEIKRLKPPCKKQMRRKVDKSIVVDPVISPDGNYLLCKTRLETPNVWTNKRHGMQIYREQVRKWSTIKMPAIALFGRHKDKKRKLCVTRYGQKRYFIKDKTNREGAMKPLEDVLVRAGVLRDDCDEWMERLDLRQEVSEDGSDYVRIEITEEKD